LIEILKEINKIINASDFEKQFFYTIEEKLNELVQPEMIKYSEEFEKQATALALDLPVQKNLTEFNDNLEKIRTDQRQKLTDFVSKTLKKEGSSEAIIKIFKVFNNSLRSETSKQLFLSRKIAEEKDLERKKELDGLKKKSEDQSKDFTQKLQGAQEQIKIMEKNFQTQTQAREQQWQNSLNQIKLEKDQAVNQMQIRDQQWQATLNQIKAEKEQATTQMKNREQQWQNSLNQIQAEKEQLTKTIDQINKEKKTISSFLGKNVVLYSKDTNLNLRGLIDEVYLTKNRGADETWNISMVRPEGIYTIRSRYNTYLSARFDGGLEVVGYSKFWEEWRIFPNSDGSFSFISNHGHTSKFSVALI